MKAHTRTEASWTASDDLAIDPRTSRPRHLWLLTLLSLTLPTALHATSEDLVIAKDQRVTENIRVLATGVTIENNGTISLTGTGVDKAGRTAAISVLNNLGIAEFTLINRGQISANGTEPLLFRTDGISRIENQNSASITVGADDPLGRVIDVAKGRLEIDNAGFIGSRVYSRNTLDAFNGGTLVLRNAASGEIVSRGAEHMAIDGFFLPFGSAAVPAAQGVIEVNNVGLIAADGTAISLASSSRVINTGRIEGGAAAVVANGNDNEVVIGTGSRIVGALVAAEGSTGNRLAFDLGAGTSFVYETSGPWIVEDLDGRAVVRGSAIAAGIGQLEAADELMAMRHRAVEQALTTVTPTSTGLTFVPHGVRWTRPADVADPTVLALDGEINGATLAGRSRFDEEPLTWSVSYLGSSLEIDAGEQGIDSRSVVLRGALPELVETGAWTFGLRAYLARHAYETRRRVLTNTAAGEAFYSGSFDSFEYGAAVTARHELNPSARVSLVSSLDLGVTTERLEAYAEGPYFSWDARDLTQGVADASVELSYHVDPRTRLFLSASAEQRRVLSGRSANYAINEVPVSFSGGLHSASGYGVGAGMEFAGSETGRARMSAEWRESDEGGQTTAFALGLELRF